MLLSEMVVSTVVLIAAFVVCVVSGKNNKNELNDILFKNSNYEFIDLTHPFNNDTIYWPNVQKFIFTEQYGQRREDGSWYATNNYASGEHVGTHIDAPYHFKETGLHVGQLPLEKLILPLIVVDVSSKVNDNPNFVLYKHDLDYMLNDNFGRPCIVIFKFGWSKYFNDRKKYLGENKLTGTLNFPGLSGEVAEWIVTSHKNVVGIGVDVASTDPGSSKDFPVHKIISDVGVYGLENVNFNRDIPDCGCTALVLPMNIEFGTGAPLRLVAICPKQNPTHF